MLNVLSLIYIHDYLNHLNTTLVNVKQLLLIALHYANTDLNTTLVNVKLNGMKTNINDLYSFKYNSC